MFLLASSITPADEPPVPKGRRLREIVADHFPRGNVLIGGTTGSWSLGKTHGIILDREFSYVTPENDFKHGTIRRRPGTLRSVPADKCFSPEPNTPLKKVPYQGPSLGHGQTDPPSNLSVRDGTNVRKKRGQALFVHLTSSKKYIFI